jgi:Carbohydrate binding domain./Bacterial Ig-like domain (group 3).
MKRLVSVFTMVLLAVILVACTTTPTDTQAPTLNGVNDVTVYVGGDFDPLSGVISVDNRDGIITDKIEVSGSYSTETPGTYFLRYVIEDEAGNRTEATRYLNVVIDPSLLGDDMVPNGDFGLGWAIWSATTGVEGGNATYTVEDGELIVNISSVAGAMWEPRLENIGIQFEQGKIYNVQFDARAAAPRAINVQVGELLPAAPWFTDFKPTTPTIFDLSTTMKTFNFSFQMDLETNPRGSLLFEMGTVPGTVGTDNLLTTVYMDNVVIREASSLVDTVAPVINGAANKSIAINTMFDALEGVTVSDNVDGEIPVANVTVTGSVDTAVLGDYVLTYKVSDAAGNENTVTRTITVIAEVSVDLTAQPTFGWRSFLNDWEGTAGSLSAANGELTLELSETNALDANWKVQIIQDAFALGTGADNVGSIQFEAGKTYRARFDAKASVAGAFSLVIGHAGNGFTPYYVEELSVGTDSKAYSIEFTLNDDAIDYTVPAQFKLEMGFLFAGTVAPQSFTLSNVVIEVSDNEAFVATKLIENGTFGASYGWRTFLNDWEGTTGSVSARDGELTLLLTGINALDANWKVQIIQDAFALGTGADNVGSIQFEAGKTYRARFDAKASVAGGFSLAIGHAGNGWTPYYVEELSVGTDSKAYSVEFTLDDDAIDYTVPGQFKLEMGMLFTGLEAPQSFTVSNVVIEVMENGAYVATDLIINGDFN